MQWDLFTCSSLIRQYRMPVCTAAYGGSGAVLEDLSSPTWTSLVLFVFIKQYVKLEDVTHTVDWFLIFMPLASLPVHSGEVREMLPFAVTPCSVGLPTDKTFLHLVQNDRFIFFGHLWNILPFIKFQDTGLLQTIQSSEKTTPRQHIQLWHWLQAPQDQDDTVVTTFCHTFIACKETIDANRMTQKLQKDTDNSATVQLWWEYFLFMAIASFFCAMK